MSSMDDIDSTTPPNSNKMTPSSKSDPGWKHGYLIPGKVIEKEFGFWSPWRIYHVAPFSTSASRNRAPLEMAAKDGELRVFIVAGEVSGDSIASRFMASLKSISPFPVNFSGVGGYLMSEQGLQSLFPLEDIAVMGLWELLPHLNKIRVRLKETIEAAIRFKPHVVLTVDSKGFSFRLLKQLKARYSQHKLNEPVHFHYVAPSFWAWKGGEERLRGLAGFVDHVLCILPNEDAVCRSNGLPASFVGHPMLEDVLERYPSSLEWKIFGKAEEFRNKYAIPSGATVISLLPGSRIQEVKRMLPIYASTMTKLKDTFPELVTTIIVAPNQAVEKSIKDAIHKLPTPSLLIPGGSVNLKYDAFCASKVALCTSGTIALELQLARLPCVVAYRAHPFTEWFVQYKAKIQYISLPNILLNSAVIPEALFRACTPAKLASLLKVLINDDDCRKEQIVAAEKVFKLLQPPEMIISSLHLQNLDSVSPYHSPSVIAACTVLNYGLQ